MSEGYPRQVVFVRQGAFGLVTTEEYDEWLQAMIRTIAGLRTKDYKTQQEVVLAEVEVVADVAALQTRVARGRPVDVVFFISRSEIETARSFQRDHPGIRVIVLTGLIPRYEVVIIEKGWCDAATFANLIDR